MSNTINGTVATKGAVKGNVNVVYGKDGKDGYTPIKGVDYFDGEKGDKGDTGNSGVYLGTGDMPEDCNVQIDPEGDVLEVINIGNALKGNKSGGIVSITDVSPIEHNVGVKVSGVEDLSEVSVKKYGKNLCNLGTVTIEKNENNGSGHKKLKLNYPLKANVPYFLSAFVESTDTDATYSSIVLYDVNGSHIMGSWVGRENANRKNKFTPTRDVYYIDFLASTDNGLSVGDTATFSNILIATEDNSADYEPFIEPTTYTPNENGIVDGVTSLYPSMTLMTDMDGVTIDAEYNRDINKAFAELQNAVINMGGVL